MAAVTCGSLAAHRALSAALTRNTADIARGLRHTPRAVQRPERTRSGSDQILRNRLGSWSARRWRSGLTVRARQAEGSDKFRVVFLGTPEVAAIVLDKLLSEASKPESSFKVSAVVTQPGRPKGRKKIPVASPVEDLARERGLPDDVILTPVSAKDEDFLTALEGMAPDLCVTAAYGNFLPTRFLSIPRFGTLNVHPSLLPALRGAAPVQRALESGIARTGVSVAFTVLKMDAGPVLAREEIDVDPNIKAPEMLENLFRLGSDLLVSKLDSVWAGEAAQQAEEQDPEAATHTAKLTKEEGVLNFEQSAIELHNRVRGFAGWPGTEALFTTLDGDGQTEQLKLKVITTRVGDKAEGDADEVVLRDGAFVVSCGEDSALEILELQPPGKKVMDAKAFHNGLKTKQKRLLKGWRGQ